LPLELINSLRLLAGSRAQYLNAILDYNRAQFELYVAIGKPPADVLIRPVTGFPSIPVEAPPQEVPPQPPPAPAVPNAERVGPQG
jgi:outer membrane protein TolC